MGRDEYQDFITNSFDKIKRFNKKNEYLCIPILNDMQTIVGLIKPITYDYNILYPDCIDVMSKWRRENPSLSNSVFDVTNERTQNWIENLILKRKDRLLFFIDDLNNNHIGHIAYSSFDFKENSAEIDAVLHGEKGNIPGIMTYSVKAMLYWGRTYLHLRNIYLLTNDDNVRAIQLYERCGFKTIGRIPLYKRVLKDEIRWDADESRNEDEAERFEIRMKYMEMGNIN